MILAKRCESNVFWMAIGIAQPCGSQGVLESYDVRCVSALTGRMKSARLETVVPNDLEAFTPRER